jgi:hypothetical protein
LRHACLFDIWIAEHDGYKVYRYENSGANQDELLRWKRAQFHKWLDTLTVEKVEKMLNK